MNRILLALLLVLLLVPVAWAQTCPGLTQPVKCYNKETLTVGATAVPFTSSVYTSGGSPSLAVVTLETDSIRYWDTGATPTSSVGHLITLPSGISSVSFSVCGGDSVRAFKAIRVTNSASLTVSYCR